MPIDASIPLQGTQVSPLKTFGDYLNLDRSQAALDAQTIANKGAQADLNDQTAVRNLQADPSVQNADGTRNQAAYTQRAQAVGGLRGAAAATDSAGASSANQNQRLAHLRTSGAEAQVGLDTVTAAANDPRLIGSTDQNGNFTAPDSTDATKALMERKAEMIQRGVDPTKAEMLVSPFITAATHNPGALPQMLKNTVQAAIGAQGQQGAMTPQPTAVQGQEGITFRNTNPNAPNAPVGAPMSPAITPPNQVLTTPTGNVVRANATTGQVGDFGGGASTNPLTLPAGESPKTIDDMQQQRSAAVSAAANAPMQHNMSSSIRQLLDANVPTGTWGARSTWIGNQTGWKVDGTDAANYNTLGKYLERQALDAVRAGGPSTNAGLEAQITANGSKDYDRTTLRRVVDLNDAITTGNQTYAQGMENGIAARKAQGDPYPQLAKRQFDLQWGANFDPKMAEYANAIGRGDKAGADAVLGAIGKPGSQAMIDFQQKMRNVGTLAKTGSLQ